MKTACIILMVLASIALPIIIFGFGHERLWKDEIDRALPFIFIPCMVLPMSALGLALALASTN